jgi:hypothetical protein
MQQSLDTQKHVDSHSGEMQERIDPHSEEILREYRRIEIISIIWFCSVTFLLAVVIFLSGLLYKNLVQSWLISAAISLITSLFFTMFFTLVVERAKSRAASKAQSLEITTLKHVVSQMIRESTTTVSEKIVGHVQQMLEEEATRLVVNWPELLPEDYFPPAKESNPQFRKKLAEGLTTTTQYMFRGSTGRYISAFLEKHGRTGLKCSILVVDPRETHAVRVCAVNRYAVRSGAKLTKQFEAEIREEIYVAIVRLFDLREHFKIEIGLCNDLLFYRSEILDDAAFISFYTATIDAIYPPTYVYSRTKGGFYYGAFRRDFEQSWEYAKDKFSMTIDTSEEALQEFLLRIGAAKKENIQEKIAQLRSSTEPGKPDYL